MFKMKSANKMFDYTVKHKSINKKRQDKALKLKTSEQLKLLKHEITKKAKEEYYCLGCDNIYDENIIILQNAGYVVTKNVNSFWPYRISWNRQEGKQ